MTQTASPALAALPGMRSGDGIAGNRTAVSGLSRPGGTGEPRPGGTTRLETVRPGLPVRTGGPPRGAGHRHGPTWTSVDVPGRGHGHHPHLRLVDHSVRPGSDRSLNDWATWMRAASMSPHTITDRVQLVERLEAATGQSSLTMGWEPIAGYLADEQFQPGTRQTYHAHLRCWFHWLVLMEHRADDPMDKLKAPPTPRRVPHPVSIEQLSAILTTRMHRRTRVMVLLGAYEGLRDSEIAAVQGDDLDGGRLWVTGKGDVRDYVPIHDLVAEAAETMPRHGWWFPSHTRPGEHISGNSVSAILSQLMRRAGVPLTAHALRHFFGTETLRATGNLALTQKLMRHASITSTVIYTLVEDAERRAAVAALPMPRSAAA